jgi:hypothetical protein
MALYLVRAKPRKEILENFHKELRSGRISKMRPFGQALQYSLENVVWVEEDYCSPPLAMERESVLDQYFSDITVERVESEEERWDRIQYKPRLWK